MAAGGWQAAQRLAVTSEHVTPTFDTTSIDNPTGTRAVALAAEAMLASGLVKVTEQSRWAWCCYRAAASQRNLV
jgi:hypothetical protein